MQAFTVYIYIYIHTYLQCEQLYVLRPNCSYMRNKLFLVEMGALLLGVIRDP